VSQAERWPEKKEKESPEHTTAGECLALSGFPQGIQGFD